MRKTLTLDIETSPHLCYSFQTWNANIMPVQILEPTRMISFSAKWLGHKRVYFHSEYEGFAPEGVSRIECHESMVQAAFNLLDEADVLVTYNGNKFDIPHLGREFRKYHLGEPSPYVSVDLYRAIKKEEIWASHKLAYLTEQLNLSGKLDNSGWRLWLGVLSEDPEVRDKAWREMRRYNKRDTATTEELFEEYLPQIKNLPAAALFDEEISGDLACPNCKSGWIQSRGYAYTKTRRYPRYQCQTCTKWFKGTRSEGSAGTT
jgi:DNA polymerase elongation subunit (family B)